jgi:DNA-binding NtrC family response regulator
MVHLPLPALRARDGDVLLLANAFLAMHGARYRKPRLYFTPQAEKRLLAWHWPGNVRELRNMLEQIVLMAQGDAITAEDVLFPSSAAADDAFADEAVPLAETLGKTLNLEDMERQYLVTALVKSGWNVTHAARMLGLSRDTLRYRMEKYSLRSKAQ